ncbi:hypothetical protein DLAC_00803 [Tieghemostelium lacteum]|uniref:Paramecium surface antigen repeat-containing protein n=1 Tax=Tieghemostelium lacteum TaxID=361077 RepID=A0A152A709_TIELA|nr:hypothetical protein DLAC_00803 [Tieghemostelium lacteum]|eukprot:KYR02010.1 hypothetical protein DLAC_00803 [Tieghemostelium lacteum]
MKLILLGLIVLIGVHAVVAGKCSIRGIPDDAVCKDRSGCRYPLICNAQGICSQYKKHGDSCQSSEECGDYHSEMSCVGGQCALEGIFNDQCNSSAPCKPGLVCNSMSICVFENDQCSSSSQCPFGKYCDGQSCQSTKSAGDSCDNSEQCSCQNTCVDSKCVPKWATKSNQGCTSSEECNIFSGATCDGLNHVCRPSNRIGESCYVDGDCQGGTCLCDGSKTVCYGPNTTMPQSVDNCKEQYQAFTTCMEDKQCTRVNPITCHECFKLKECYEGSCFAKFNLDPHRSTYYKKLSCPTILKSVDTKPGSNNNDNEVQRENGELGNEQSSSSATLLNVSVLSIISFLLCIF